MGLRMRERRRIIFILIATCIPLIILTFHVARASPDSGPDIEVPGGYKISDQGGMDVNAQQSTNAQPEGSVHIDETLSLVGTATGAGLAAARRLMMQKQKDEEEEKRSSKQGSGSKSKGGDKSLAIDTASNSARGASQGKEDEKVKRAKKGSKGSGSNSSRPLTQGSLQNSVISKEGEAQRKEDEQMKRSKSGSSGSNSKGSSTNKYRSGLERLESSTAAGAITTQRKEGEQVKGAKMGTGQAASTSSGNVSYGRSSYGGAAKQQRREDKQVKRAKSGSGGSGLKSSSSSTGGSSVLGSFASSLSGAAHNTWARLQGFGSAIASGFNNLYETVRPYAPYITMAAGVVLVVAGSFVTFGAAAPAGAVLAGGTVAGVGMGASIGVGLGSVGLGLGLEAFALHNLGIMNYPQQLSFRERHMQQYTQQQTLESKMEKGSGHYGEDAAEEQLEQSELIRDRFVQTGQKHQEVEKWAKERLKGENQTIQRENKYERDPVTGESLSSYGKPDISTEKYIVECKQGTNEEFQRYYRSEDQAKDFVELVKELGNRGVEKTLIYWFFDYPESKWEQTINFLIAHGAKVLYGPNGEEIFGGG